MLHGRGQLHFSGIGADGIQLDKLPPLDVEGFAQRGHCLQLGADGGLHRLHGSGTGFVLGQLVQGRFDSGVDIAAELPQGQCRQHQRGRYVKFDGCTAF